MMNIQHMGEHRLLHFHSAEGWSGIDINESLHQTFKYLAFQILESFLFIVEVKSSPTIHSSVQVMLVCLCSAEV